MTSADGSGVITTYEEGLARRLKALACTAPLHDLDLRKVRLDWCDGAEYQMAEIALQAIDQVTVAMDFDRGAAIAGTVSYLHMHLLVEEYGQPGWVAALTPLSVDGMIVAASTTLLAESRSGNRGGLLPWTLLVIGSVASLAANVAVAEPTATGRVIAAWPSFALIASYELLMRQVRHAAGARTSRQRSGAVQSRPGAASSAGRLDVRRPDGKGSAGRGREAQVLAWQWALANSCGDGSLPSGRDIGRQHGRHERWGRLVKRSGLAGEWDSQT